MAKYPERIFAVIKSRSFNDQVRLFRYETRILFNDDTQLLGTVYMTNPGSFSLDKHPNWADLQKAKIGEIQGYSSPDTTMQNLISVIRSAYQAAGITPSGYVAIYNISTLVESDGRKIEQLHSEAMNALSLAGESTLLQETACHQFDTLNKHCHDSKFVILGFLNNVFPEEIARIKTWTCKHANKLVYATDQEGNFIHPYRWRLLPEVRLELHQKLLGIIESSYSSSNTAQ